jgi:hypothetical protein
VHPMMDGVEGIMDLKFIPVDAAASEEVKS